jgi:uncharacterized protein YcbK (DUF882 family)
VSDQTADHIARLERFTSSLALEFVNDARLAGYAVVITSSVRSLQQQQQLLAQGRTTTLASKHLTGQAFDIDIFGKGRDSVPTWVWENLGPFGESVGLKWGGRWQSFKDVGHFEV